MEASQETSRPFDDEAWTSYTTAVEEMMMSTRVLRKDKMEDLAEARAALLSRNQFPLNASSQLSVTTTRDDWRAQAKEYKKHYNLTTQQFNFVMRVLVYMGDYCARARISSPIQVAWEKLKESGMVPAENAFSTYMYILGTNSACRDSLIEVAQMHDVFFSPNEKTITLRIKTLIAKNEIAQAEEILSSLKVGYTRRDFVALSFSHQGRGTLIAHTTHLFSLQSGNDGEFQKLRTFLPILDHYCSNGDCKSILRLFREMREAGRVHFDADTYTLILCTLAEEGCFSVNASPIEDAAKVGFNATSGPELFDQVVTELAQDLLELTEDSCRKLAASFSRGICPEDVVGDGEVPSLTNVTQPKSSPLVLGRTKIDVETALCPATGAKLRLINLDEQQRQHVHDTLIEMAEMQFVEFTKGRSQNFTENLGLQELTKFSEWLE